MGGFVRWLGWPALASGGVALLVVGALLLRVELEMARNAEKIRFLKTEIEKLDPQIAEVANFREILIGILGRKQVIETLVMDRHAVQLFEELARRRPGGTYLVSLESAGRQLSIIGYAESPAKADAFLRNLAESALFKDARLIETRQEARKPQAVRFALSVSLR
jgi:type IV pilus assembly protein PilN